MNELATAYRRAMTYGLENAVGYSDDLFPELLESTQQVINSAADSLAANLTRGFEDNPDLRAKTNQIVDEWIREGDWDLGTLREKLELLPDFDPARALMVARTQTAEAFNSANLIGLTSHGWELFEWNAAFDSCEYCAERAEGGPYTAAQIIADGMIEHPNCRCSIDPVIDEDQND